MPTTTLRQEYAAADKLEQFVQLKCFLFYELLTGELPLGRFDAPSQKVQVDVRLDEIVLLSLENEPSRRYQQATQIKTDVELASRITEVACWQPADESPLSGFPKRWVH